MLKLIALGILEHLSKAGTIDWARVLDPWVNHSTKAWGSERWVRDQ